MTINKNIISLAICFAMFSSIHAQDSLETISSDETTQATVATHQLISTKDAIVLLQEFSNNLEDGTQFQINAQPYMITQNHKQINQEEANIIVSIATDIIDSVIATIAQEIQAMQVHEISQQEAITLLQASANSLVAGSSFQLNGTSYTVQGLNKTTELMYETTDSTDNENQN